AVAPANRAAFDRFEEEIAATRFDQLERGADWRFRIGDELAPDERSLARGETGACLFGVLGQGAGQENRLVVGLAGELGRHRVDRGLVALDADLALGRANELLGVFAARD